MAEGERRARVSALRALARARLSESQLWRKLETRGYDDDAIRGAIDYCKREGYLDDRLYAELFVETTRKAVGNARLVSALITRGIDREAAAAVVAGSEKTEDDRLAAAFAKIMRKSPAPSYPTAARALERLGFPAPAIYRHLREHAKEALTFADG